MVAVHLATNRTLVLVLSTQIHVSDEGSILERLVLSLYQNSLTTDQSSYSLEAQLFTHQDHTHPTQDIMSAPCPTCRPQENKCGANASCDERGELLSNSCVCFYAQRPANVDDGYRLFVEAAKEYIVFVAGGIDCDAECDNREPGDLCAEIPDVPGECTGGPTMSTTSVPSTTPVPSTTTDVPPTV